MSEHSSTKTHRTSRTSNPSTSAVTLWWNIGKRRSNSDTASISSHRSSNNRRKSNRASIPLQLTDRISSRANSTPHTQSVSYDNLGNLSVPTLNDDFDLIPDPVNDSAISDTSLEETEENQVEARTTMGDRGIRPNDRTSVVELDDRRERPRTGRNIDSTVVSGRTSTPSPSLFEACRELRRHGVKISLQSSLSFLSSNGNTGTGNNQGRQGVTVTVHDRSTIQSYPEHLLNLPSEPSLQDICLRTVLNAGASVDFVPRSSGHSLAANETFTCEHCTKRFTNEQEWYAHESREKTFCPFCELRYECHGLLLRHRNVCNGRD